jgi:cell division protein FtsL
VNKVIVVNENSVIRGNTVLKPEYNPYDNEQEEKSKERRKKIKQNKQISKRAQNKVKVMRNIALTFVVGLTLVARYCIIYNMQMELNSVKSDINAVNRDNENLKVELVKYNNLQFIEDAATNKLHMIVPDKSSAVYANLSKEVIQSSEKKKEIIEQQSIWSKLKKILF